MKKLFLLFIALNLFSYALDYPGDVKPLDANPNWKDPTLPSDLNSKDEAVLNTLDEKKLKKLKQALDILFDEEEQVVSEEVKEEVIKPANPSDYIHINIRDEGKTYRVKPSNNKNIQIKIN